MSYQPSTNKPLLPQTNVFPDNVINPTADLTNFSFDTVKPIWYEVGSGTGALVFRNSSSFGSNFFYTTANALLVVQNSQHQYVNVACDVPADMDLLCGNSGNRTSAISTLISFLQTNTFNGGVEIDFEAFHLWTSGQYANFKIFISQLRTALNAAGYFLMVDVPAIWNDVRVPGSPYEWLARSVTSQAEYLLKYEEIAPLCDYILPMVYDYQDDIGAGAPNQPLQWLADTIAWAKSKVYPNSKIIIGLPSAGYVGATGGFVTVGETFNAGSQITGFSAALRDMTGAPADSGELLFASGGNSYGLVDDNAMMLKINKCLEHGINQYSLWFMGNNRYGNPERKPTTLNQGQPVPQYATPITGDSIAILLNTTALFISPAATIATLNLVFVQGLFDGQVLEIIFTHAVTSLTTSGVSLLTALANPTAGTKYTLVWSATLAKWC